MFSRQCGGTEHFKVSVISCVHCISIRYIVGFDFLTC